MADRCSKIALSRAGQVRSAFLIPFFGTFLKKKCFSDYPLVEVVVSFSASLIVAFYMNVTARERPILGADKTSQTLYDFHFLKLCPFVGLSYIMSKSCHRVGTSRSIPNCGPNAMVSFMSIVLVPQVWH